MVPKVSKQQLQQKSSKVDEESQTNPDRLIALGRWVSTYDQESGLVSKRPINPKFGKELSSETIVYVFETVLKEIAGYVKLSQLLLLISPTRYHLHQRKLHCYDRETREHLGMTTITARELEMLTKYELLLKYEVLFTEEFFELKTLATDQQIIEQIFSRSSRFKTTLSMLQKPQQLRHVAVQTLPTKPEIKSLRKPKIPVRRSAKTPT